MVSFGYKLMTEEHAPRDLVRNARRAEEVGFDFVAISDHYLPWLESHGHAGFAWSILGAIAAQTERIGIATAVTCPYLRYHPAIIAQAAATIGVLSEGRFTLGLGAGERLNEHVVGEGWPAVHDRHRMLGEAIDIIRLLWQGGMQSYDGEYLTLEDAQVFDLPEQPIPIVVGISGKASTALALEKADGIISTEPKPDLVAGYREGGGTGPRYAEVPLCWASSTDEAVRIAHERFRFGIPGWKVMAELPNIVNFEAATSTVRPEDVQGIAACGPDVETHLAKVKEFADAGFDHLVLVGMGDDQDGFLRFYADELAPRLATLG